jgi:hypothetical protein
MKQNDRQLAGWTVLLLPIVVLLWCVVMVYGCSGAQKTPALSTLECRIALLKPYLGELTPDVVRSTLAGNPGPLARTLSNLGVDAAEITELSKAWRKCVPSETTPDAGEEGPKAQDSRKNPSALGLKPAPIEAF